jgi:hypothetical protein
MTDRELLLGGALAVFWLNGRFRLSGYSDASGFPVLMGGRHE